MSTERKFIAVVLALCLPLTWISSRLTGAGLSISERARARLQELLRGGQ